METGTFGLQSSTFWGHNHLPRFAVPHSRLFLFCLFHNKNNILCFQVHVIEFSAAAFRVWRTPRESSACSCSCMTRGMIISQTPGCPLKRPECCFIRYLHLSMQSDCRKTCVASWRTFTLNRMKWPSVNIPKTDPKKISDKTLPVLSIASVTHI